MFFASVAGVVVALLVTGPLAAKWQLGLRRVLLGTAALGLLPALLVPLVVSATWQIAVSVAVLTLFLALAVLAYRFYRDPERSAPDDPDTVVSPADGEVVYVRNSVAGTLPVATKHGRDYTLQELTRTGIGTDDAVVVGIGMSFLDVHVNRAPVAGEVVFRQHFPGLFGSLRLPEMTFENERATTVIDNGQWQIAVVQIASRLVRQIVGHVGPGDVVAAGDRIGVIRLGSQVDVVLPRRDDLDVIVRPGDRVRAGETLIATVRKKSRPQDRRAAGARQG